MGRTTHPWYFTEKQAYAATVKGKRVILFKGKESPANLKRAEKQLAQVLKGSKHDLQGGVPRVTTNDGTVSEDLMNPVGNVAD